MIATLFLVERFRGTGARDTVRTDDGRTDEVRTMRGAGAADDPVAYGCDTYCIPADGAPA